MAQGRPDHALAAYREALRVRPDDAEAHNDLGVALVGQGNVAEGIAHLEEPVRQRPLQAEYRANLEAARRPAPVTCSLIRMRNVACQP
jgi:Flp pilus assembly protein TadD